MRVFDTVKEHLLAHSYTWLVTGVAGFIGSHLLEFLLAHRQKIIGVDNFATGFQANLEAVHTLFPELMPQQFKFVEGDIRDLAVCRDVVKDVDFVLHQAALGSVPRSIKDPLMTHDVNVNGFLNILLASAEAKVQRFVYASSSSVYGDSLLLPKVETHQGQPLSPYAASKMADELYAKAFGVCYNINTIGLRYFNVFGARQNPSGPYAAVIPLWIKALINGEDVYINGDGNTSRDFCYVKNAVQANILAALVTQAQAFNQVYNIAVGQKTTLNELYQFLSARLPTKAHHLHYQDFRPGDIQHSLADISRARQLLGYQPEYTLQQGLDDFVSHYC